MGYDVIECLFCYTRNGGNNYTENRVDICFVCLEERIGKRITGRVLDIFQEDIITGGNCSVCSKDRKLLISVRCCDAVRHLQTEK